MMCGNTGAFAGRATNPHAGGLGLLLDLMKCSRVLDLL
jgi:hypothetical protein